MSSYMADKRYVVQTNPKIIERCMLMTTDPGDLVLDPDVWFRHDRICCRAMGPPVDHNRHQPRCGRYRAAAATDRQVRVL